MPFKGGRFTPQERAFIEPMARTGDAVYAATKAGLGAPDQAGYKLLARPAVRAAVIQKHQDLLFDELLPLAYAAHKRLLTDKATPAGALNQAVKLAYDRTLGAAEGEAAEKEPSEMSYDELQASIARLKREQESREEGAKDVTPEPALEPHSIMD